VAWNDFRHRLPLRVRWAEADMQGVVFNGHYLTYCDVCITEYWRAIGLAYPQDLLAAGSDTFVRKATVEYLDAARFDDELEVCGRVAAIGTSSLRFAIEIFKHGATDAPLISAELVYVNADPVTRSSRPWPEPVRALVRAYEVLAPQESGSGAR
jgi:acyl-CoA thioester hydrolase